MKLKAAPIWGQRRSLLEQHVPEMRCLRTRLMQVKMSEILDCCIPSTGYAHGIESDALGPYLS